MTPTVDPHEVDELIASMEPTTPEPVVRPLTAGPTIELPLPGLLDSAAASPTTHEETAREKLTPSTPPQGTPRLKNERSVSPSSSLAQCGVPPLLATNEPPPSTANPPRVTTPPLSLAIATETGPCDLDALAELLRTDSQPFLPQRDLSGELHKASGSPRLLSSSHKSLSFSPSTFSARRSTMLQTQGSFTLSGLVSSASDDQLGAYSPRHVHSPQSASRLNDRSISPMRRRLTIGAHEISPHALERLGVNTDILKKEKGMKKLGISDVDIERFEEIRRYSGVPLGLTPVTKVEFMFGFTKEQLLRAKAMNRLGTSEQEVQDEYSRQISRLGVHDAPIVQY